MSTTLAIAAFVATAVFLIGCGLVFLRGSRPHSQRMANAQASLNRKAGVVSGSTHATATPSGAAGGWFGQNMSTILYAFGGGLLVILLFVWWFMGPDLDSSMEAWTPDFLTLANLAYAGGFWFLAGWIALAVWLSKNHGDKGWAKSTRKWSGIALVLLWVIGFAWQPHSPLRTWWESDSSSRGTSIPSTKNSEDAWPQVNIPPGGKSDPIALRPGKLIRAKGNNFLSVYVYPGNRECTFGSNCPDGFASVYFKNTSATQPAKVIWAYRD